MSKCWNAMIGLICLLSSLDVAHGQTAGKFDRAVDIRTTPLRTNTLEQYGSFPLTVEMWVKLSSEKQARFNLLVANSTEGSAQHWEIYTTPLDGLLSAKLSAFKPAVVPSYVRITDDRWHYVALTCDGHRVALYVDGRQVADQSVTPVGRVVTAEGELFVGTQTEYVKEQANVSLLDELRISDTIRNCGRVPEGRPFAVDEHTVGLWRFDEPSGTSRVDESKHRNALAYSPGIEAAWTPRSSTRPDAEEWERHTDADWRGTRFNEMDKGGLLGVSMSTPSTLGRSQGPYVPKGLAIGVGERNEATVLFDRGMLQLSAAWRDGFVHIPERRFGLIQHPEVAGTMLFSTPTRPGWERPPGAPERDDSPWSPLPVQWARYNGLYRHGKRTILDYSVNGTRILDMPWMERARALPVLTRTIETAGCSDALRMNVLELPADHKARMAAFSTQSGQTAAAIQWRVDDQKGQVSAVAMISPNDQASLRLVDDRVVLEVAPRREPVTVKLLYGHGGVEDRSQFKNLIRSTVVPVELSPLTKGGPPRWVDAITTQEHREDADDGKPFLVDTLTLPYENPYGSIMRVTGVGFLPGGKIAICTIHGDVWIVNAGGDDSEQLRWKRFAAGLYQPFGIAVTDGTIHVLERGQITALYDLNRDGEADVYENVYNGWQSTGSGHAYDTALKLAPDGSFYFFKGQAGTPYGNECGCLLRVLPDASSHEVFATGFRHPIGLGMSPTGVVTGADQQGNWIPATRIDWFRQGGFYGDMRTHHRDVPPETYDPPLCWLPRYVDNSASGQVWIPKDRWGPLGGSALHLSYGRCWVFLLMHETVDGQVQGGVVRLPIDRLISGPITGAFNPQDGHLYIVGMHGWQTAAEKDGCLLRLRYTGNNLYLPTALQARREGIHIRFSEPLDRPVAQDAKNYELEQWNYRYSGSYGSDHWSVADPDRMGHDVVDVQDVRLSDDGREVQLRIDDLRPVMQMKIAYRLRAADGTQVNGEIHNTIHALGPSKASP